MSASHGTHNDLHSEYGALTGEHPGRAKNPVIKVEDIAWLEFEKPDLRSTEAFAHAFGFATAARSATELHLRGVFAGSPCVIVRRGPRSRFLGPAFRAAETVDVARLAEATGAPIQRLPDSLGGIVVNLRDPSGTTVKVVADTLALPSLPTSPARSYNYSDAATRINATQRPDRAPASIERLGHVVLQSTRFRETLDWYLMHLGLIVSDFKYYEGQRAKGPTMSFIRCDRGSVPTDHHTLALTLGPRNRYVHSAFQVSDLDSLAAGGQHLIDQGYTRSWGIGRHIEGSQIFDYWRDPDGLLVEHFTDGDLFDHTLVPGWSPMTASGLAQWGPPVSRDFIGADPRRTETLRELGSMVRALRSDNEFDVTRLRGLMKVAMT